jgi:hypothetical protein
MNEELGLSVEERELLVELLQHELEELHVEIHHTQVTSAKEELKVRREILRGLLERLQPVPATKA